jgi:hypothetical protein
MPAKREIDVYQFDELPAKAKQRAIEAYREHAWDDTDSKNLTDYFRDELKNLGLPSGDIRWRLSYSQGDGVAFYGKFDIEDYMRANKLVKEFRSLLTDPLPYAEIVNIGGFRYDHWNTMRVQLERQTDLTPKQEALLANLKEDIAEHIKDVSRDLEKIGYADIESRTGDEAIAETLSINEYEYDANGNRL